MAKEDAFLVDYFKVVYVLQTMPGYWWKMQQWKNKDKGKWAKEVVDPLESSYMAEDSSVKEIPSHLRIEESLRAHDSDKGKGKEVGGPSVNMTEEGKNKHNKQNKGKKRSNENKSGSSSNKKNQSWECWKCGKMVTSKGLAVVVDAIAWWIDSGATNFPDDSDSVYMSSSTVVNSTLWHARLGHVHYKRMLEMSKDDLIPAIDENLKKCLSEGFWRSHSKDIIPNVQETQMDDHTDDVPNEILEPRRAIDDEIGSIMENNTWVLSDLPPGCKSLGCKWIFKRKMKVDGTIDKFKARLLDKNLVEDSLLQVDGVFLLGGGCHFMASKKQTCFIVFYGIEVVEIGLLRAPTMARAYSLIYNGKSRHLGLVAYKLELPRELQGIHNTFHVSNIKKCLSDEVLIIPFDEVRIDEKLHFIEEPIEIMDREVKQLKQSRIPIVKVRWNSSRGPEYTWEREDQMWKKYPHLFDFNKKQATR
ncbi:putative reverse transcriptase domain-containing protein [Tanacetum coccineum]